LLEGNRELAESEQRFRLLVESVTDYAIYVTDYAIYMIDPQGTILTWNMGAERSKGYRSEEVLGQNYCMFFTPEARNANMPQDELASAATAGSFETEGWRLRKGGAQFWAHVTLTAIRGSNGELRGFAKVTRDMTAPRLLAIAQANLASQLEEKVAERTLELAATVSELRTKNEEVEALAAKVSADLGEKEVLLREIYHRVKNNLQMVQSLLKMGARTVGTTGAREAIETAVQRVHVMAMVHEHLYQMPNLAGLTLSAYLRDVADGAIACNSEHPEQIKLNLDIDPVAVPLDSAIPMGLLVNELVSNCLKHGIPIGKPGTISVSARSMPHAVRFVIHDNGKGLPDGFDAAKSPSMGLKLASSLAHQLGGRLEFTSSNGCRVQADLTRLAEKPVPPQLVTNAA
jgi:PAS domain S-box-containing protein